MNWVSFFFGAFVGFIIEWAVDLFYWRQQHGQKAAELEAAQAEMRDLDARYQKSLHATQTARNELETASASLAATAGELNTLKEQLAAAHASGESVAAQLAECQEHLQANEADVAHLSARMGEADETIASLRAELAAAQSEAESLAQRVAKINERAAVDMPVAGDASEMPAETTESDAPDEPLVPDDLKKIEGIGKKIAELLQNAGIITYAQLAETEVSRLQAVLAEAGSRFQLADPGSWPKQAALAAAGDWEGLRHLQDSLKGGRSTKDDVQPL